MLIVYRKSDGKVVHNTGKSNIHPEGISDTNGKLAVIERHGGTFEDYGIYRLHDIEESEMVNQILNAYDYELSFNENGEPAGLNFIEKPLDMIKEEKINTLSGECQNAIVYGFTASNGNKYRLTIEDQLNMQGQKSALDDDPDITTVNWMTLNDDIVTHPREEWLDVYKEAFQHKNENIFKNKQLRDQVNAATTKEEVEAVVWQ